MPAAVNVEKILIVVDGRHQDADLILSAAVLAKTLAEQANTKVDLFAGTQSIPKSLRALIVPRGINLIEKISAPNYTLAIDRGDVIVEEVRWEQNKGKINVMLYTKGGSIDPTTIAYDPTKPKYDQVIGLGFTHIDQLKAVMGEKADVLNAAKTHLLHFVDLPNTGANYPHSYPQQQAYAGVVLNHLRKLELKLNPETAGELLCALSWATDQFSNFRTFSTTFVLWSELVRSGADIQRFVRDTRNLSPELQRIQQQLIARQKNYPDLVISEIEGENAEAAQRDIWHLDMNPLRRFATTAIAIFKGEHKTVAVVSSQTTNDLVSKLAALPAYAGLAGAISLSHHCVVEFSGTAETVAEQVKQLIELFQTTGNAKVNDAAPVNVRPSVPLAFEVMPKQPATQKPQQVEEKEDYDPLAPANEKLEPEVDETSSNLGAPAGGGFGGGFGGMGGMGMGGLGGGMGTPGAADPLPAAKA
jgi:hypothetical protein